MGKEAAVKQELEREAEVLRPVWSDERDGIRLLPVVGTVGDDSFVTMEGADEIDLLDRATDSHEEILAMVDFIQMATDSGHAINGNNLCVMVGMIDRGTRAVQTIVEELIRRVPKKGVPNE